MPARYRADLVDVAWAKEHAYGVVPPTSALAELITAGGTSEAGMLRGQWGLVTGGVDLPTPTFDWQPFYGIGVMNRNMLFPVQGRERLEGAVSQTLLCHDASRLFLEQMLGLAFNGKNADVAYYASTGTYTPSSGNSTTTATAFTVASDNFTAYKASPPTHIIVVADTVGAGAGNVPDRTQDTWAYIGTGGNADTVNVFKAEALGTANAGWNGIRPPQGTAHQFSIHGIAQTSSALAHGSPSGVNHAAVQSITRDGVYQKHVLVRPTLVQPSFTLGARFRADDGSNFITNYSGCKISRCTFNFEEGNPVNFGANFMTRDFSHNIGEDDISGTGVETMKYKAVGTGATNTIAPNYMKNIRVTEQPYFYSSVQLTFQGEPIARFRRFTITIDNGLDPRYYVTQNDASSPRDNRQILHEILEGRRNISFGGSLDLDDDGATGYPVANSPTDAQFLRYLLNQAMTSSDIRDQNTLKGIGILIELRKVNSFANAAYAHDKIKFHIPSNVTSDLGSESEVGMVLRSTPLNIPAPPSVHIPMDIDGMASSMHIEIMDGVAAGD